MTRFDALSFGLKLRIETRHMTHINIGKVCRQTSFENSGQYLLTWYSNPWNVTSPLVLIVVFFYRIFWRIVQAVRSMPIISLITPKSFWIFNGHRSTHVAKLTFSPKFLSLISSLFVGGFRSDSQEWCKMVISNYIWKIVLSDDLFIILSNISCSVVSENYPQIIIRHIWSYGYLFMKLNMHIHETFTGLVTKFSLRASLIFGDTMENEWGVFQKSRSSKLTRKSTSPLDQRLAHAYWHEIT